MARRKHTLVVGTRASRLALWQTRFVVSKLTERFPDLEYRIETFTTIGDDIVDRPLPELGGKGVFTARLESALLKGHVDIAVHSLKDLPIEMPQGLVVGAVTHRADARDVLVTRDGVDIDGLPAGAIIGTSSLRRQAQLLHRRPDLKTRPIRGNVETRMRKVMNGDYDATILAAAGVDRLQLETPPAGRLPLEVMLPAPGQGALAVECRANDFQTLKMLGAINDDDARRSTQAERAFLAGLGGGCAAPVAAYAKVEGYCITLTGLVANPDGTDAVRVEASGAEPVALGEGLAAEAAAKGAGAILDAARRALEGRLPLHGKRIAVTRAADQAEEVCAALSGLGATPIRVPVIRTVALADRATIEQITKTATTGDWVVFTSANGVAAACNVASGNGYRKAFKGLRVAAVGAKTALALQRRSIVPDFVPGEFSGEAVAREMPDVAGKNVWLLRAETAGETIVTVLAQRGANVHDVPVYRTEREDFTAEAVKDLESGVDAILFTSGSTVKHFAAACAERGWDIGRFGKAVVACIGDVTGRTAEKLGFKVSVTPSEYTISALIDAVADYFNEVTR
jgi:hydroxymethylbilane synthase